MSNLALPMAARALAAGELVLVAGTDGSGATVAAAAPLIGAAGLASVYELGGELAMLAVTPEHAARLGLAELPAATRPRAGIVPASAPALELRALSVARELERDAVDCDLPTRLGMFTAVAHAAGSDGETVLALVHGDPGRDPAAALVHTHVACLLGDTFGSLLCDCHERLDRAARAIVAAGAGVIVYVKPRPADPFACPAGEPVDPALARGLLGRAGLTGEQVAA